MAQPARHHRQSRKTLPAGGPKFGLSAVLKEHAAGLSAAELCRKYGVSEPTFYKWRSRYGGMEVSDARKLKALEDENRRLKKLLAESMLDAATLKEMLGKNF
jgi:putative transposase